MNVVLFDAPQERISLRPFSYTRSLAEIRVGISTIEEKWKRYFTGDYSFITTPYLRRKFPCIAAEENLCINSTVFPDDALVAAIRALKSNQKLVKDSTLLAALCDNATLQGFQADRFSSPNLQAIAYQAPCTQIRNNWDIFLLNNQELRRDLQWLSKEKTTQQIQDPHTIAYNEGDIFLEEGVSITAAILNAQSGPIYLGKNSIIQEGAIIKGPVAIGEHATISAGARISNATTVGPHAKVGGEVSNSVIFGYTNKAHDGYMGNSVIGEWCNLGAGTNTSNLRNDYGEVKAWDEQQGTFASTGMQFCGLFMGDHSKCGINAMFNAGTTVDVSANLFGAGFFDKNIPSFAWGMPDAHKSGTYHLATALEAAERMASRRSVAFTEEDKQILITVFNATAAQRRAKKVVV
jgi:UDP-N-acetylglucosamine diphosphorylase/glucosamine-1-phosphate N-acetyltransferase